MASAASAEVSTTFISFVGQSPAGVAVPLATWARHYGSPGQIVLLASPLVSEQAARISAWIGSALPGVQHVTFNAPDNPELTSDVLLSWIHRHAAHHRLVLLIGPGRKISTTLLARQLRDVTTVADDADRLVVMGPTRAQPETAPLVDLGLTALWQLHGLEKSVSVERQGSSLDVQLRLTGGGTLTLTRVAERAGRIYALAYVPNGNEAKIRIRGLERLSSHRELLRGLRLHVTVMTDNDAARSRAISGGFAVIATRDERHWTPGSGALGRPHGLVAQGLPAAATGAGGTTHDTLVTWLGTDAMMTLLAIYSHQPRKTIVLVDTTTGRTVELAHRLAAVAAEIPTGEVAFLGSDLFGSLPVGRGADALAEATVFNVQAGTAMQSFAVARHTAAALWSIKRDSERQSRGGLTLPLVIWPFDPAFAKRPVFPVPISVVARINAGPVTGGHLTAPPRTPVEDDALVLLGRIVENWMVRRGRWHLPDLRQGKSEFIYSEGAHSATVRALPHGSSVQVSIDQLAPLTLCRLSSGEWLEEVVAACLRQAGADEVVRGLEIRTPPQTAGVMPSVRDELDVVARFGTDYFLFDCKAGDVTNLANAGPESRGRQEGDLVHRAESSALAARLLRFAIPVCVRSRVRKVDLAKRGPAVIGLSDVVKSARLRLVLEPIARRSSSDT